MTEIDKRLQVIEKKLDFVERYSLPYGGGNNSSQSDEVDIRELWNAIWKNRWIIVVITFAFSIIGFGYSITLPDVYKSEGVYAPAHNKDTQGLSGEFGGLAAMAGINIGRNKSNDIDQAMALIVSWAFLENVIDKHDLKSLIMAVKEWDRENRKLIWDGEVYDYQRKKWLDKKSDGQIAEPSSYKVYRTFYEMLEVGYDSKSNMVNISVQHFSPIVAKRMVDILVAEVNLYFQTRDMVKAKSSIEYLEKKINETSVSEMQSVFYGMIEGQTKTLMLAEVDESYLLVEVVQPKISEVPSSPKRALIVFMIGFLGGVISFVGVVIRYLFKGL